MISRRARLAALILTPLVATVALLAGCSSSSSSTENLPAAADLLSKSATAMRAVKTASIEITVDPALKSFPIHGAKGKLTSAGDVMGTATLDSSGSPVEFTFVITGGFLYLQGPTGSYQKLPLALASTVYDPSKILDPDRGVAKLLSSATGGQTQAKENVNGADAYRVSAKLNRQAVAALAPGISSDVNGLLWIDVATNRLVKAQLDVPGAQGSGGGPVTVTLGDFDAPVTVTPPA